jgi:hypothetical protein
MKKSVLLIKGGIVSMLLVSCNPGKPAEDTKPLADSMGVSAVPVDSQHPGMETADPAQPQPKKDPANPLPQKDPSQPVKPDPKGQGGAVVITHNAPDQKYIDSVKAAKLKGKFK